MKTTTNVEAAKYRKRAQESERERDRIKTIVNEATAKEISAHITNDHITLQLLEFAGYDYAALSTAQGLADPEKIAAATTATAGRFNLAPDAVNKINTTDQQSITVSPTWNGLLSNA